MDLLAQSVRLGLDPRRTRPSTAAASSWPTRPRRPARSAAGYVVDELKAGEAAVRGRGPRGTRRTTRASSPCGAPTSSAPREGQRVLPAATCSAPTRPSPPSEAPAGQARRGRRVAEEAPEGRLDLLMTIDFRMTSSTIFSDVVLPAATWYEKHDLSTTDMHPSCTRSTRRSRRRGRRSPTGTRGRHREEVLRARGRPPRHPKDVIAKPLWHDTPEAMATEHGVVKDWKTGEVDPVPGKTMPVIAVAERDYTAVFEKMTSIGPLLEKVGMLTKGVPYDVKREVDILRAAQRRGPRGRRGRPAQARDRHPDGRRDAPPRGHHQRPPGHAGLPLPREAHRHRARRPRRRARGQADHLRRHPGGAGAGDHLAGVVGVGVGRAALQPVHHQHRAQEAVPHPDRSPAVLPRPRLDSWGWARCCRSTVRRST